MSLVGTRPPTLDEWEKYEPHHRAMAICVGIAKIELNQHSEDLVL